MRKSLFVLLLVATLLVAHSEAGWFRRTFNKAKSAVKKAVDRVKTFIQTHGPNVVNTVSTVLGQIGRRKRNAQLPCSPEAEVDIKQAEKLFEELEGACPTFGIDPVAGLSSEAVHYAFDVSDEDENGSLSANELVLFEDIMDVYVECVEMMSKRR